MFPSGLPSYHGTFGGREPRSSWNYYHPQRGFPFKGKLGPPGGPRPGGLPAGYWGGVGLHKNPGVGEQKFGGTTRGGEFLQDYLQNCWSFS